MAPTRVTRIPGLDRSGPTAWAALPSSDTITNVELDLAALDPAWRGAFELAWEAWCAGTIPIGAVVTDPDGAVVSSGRNRIFTADAPPGQVSGSWLAHAEVNALLQLPADGHHAGFTITSTTEPCLLCAGAIVMSLRGRVVVRYAATDPIAGGMDVVGLSSQGRRRDIEVQRLEQESWVTFADALNLANAIRRQPGGIVETYYAEHRPQLFARAVELEKVLAAYVSSSVALADVLHSVETVMG